jgi:hypothetical protein
MSDCVAILIQAFTFLLCLSYPLFRQNRSVMFVALASLLIRYAIDYVESFLFQIIGSMRDAFGFHFEASHLEFQTKSTYTAMLRFIYSILGDSYLLGQSLSVLAFLGCMILFCELAGHLGIRQHLAKLLLLFAFLPSCVMHTALTFREPYQCLTFLCCLLGTFHLEDRKIGSGTFLLIFGVTVMSLLHNGLALYALLAGVMSLAYLSSGSYQARSLIVVACLVMGPLLAPKALDKLSEKSIVLQKAVSGDLATYASTYRTGIESARSDYGFELDTSSIVGICTTLPPIVFMYMFAPLPWQVRSGMDAYASLESILRIALLWGCWQNFQQCRGQTRNRFLFVLACTALLEFLWATGTTNWGTAVRHHVPAYGGWLLLGGTPLLMTEWNPLRRQLWQRRARRLARQAYEQEAGRVPGPA